MIRLMTCACQAQIDAKVKVEPGVIVPDMEGAGGSRIARNRASGGLKVQRAMKTGDSGWPLTEAQVLEVFAKDSLQYKLLTANKIMIYDSRDARNEFWADMGENETVMGTKDGDVYASTHILVLPTYFQVNNAHVKWQNHSQCMSGFGEGHLDTIARCEKSSSWLLGFCWCSDRREQAESNSSHVEC